MDYNTGKIKDGGGSWSPELVNFLKSKKLSKFYIVNCIRYTMQKEGK